MPKELTYGTTRRYSRVIILSILTLGIYYVLYQYWLFKDLQEHFEKAFEVEPRSYPTKNNPITMLVFLLLFPLYPIFLKYSILHDHIEMSQIKIDDNCTIGLNALVFFTVFCVCTFGIVPLINEYRWQKAYNEHILAHEEYYQEIG